MAPTGTTKRFRVAFSFAGEKRDFVEKVAALLADRFGQDAILYDKFHEAEFARRRLGIVLPDLYHDQSDLIVVVVCPDYDQKEWTGLEWVAIHDLLKGGKDNEVLLCRFDHATVQGLYGSAGFLELDRKTPEQTAVRILERLALNEGKPRGFYLSEDAPEPKREKGSTSRSADPLPTPPAFYAEPPYIGSHTFVGRKAELDQLSDWAAAANPHPVLLFEAIGGSGKSMLTWEWATKHATEVRQDWAGRFWYSFYERGAVMADFCRRALAYMTGTPMEELRKQRTPELAERLLHHLRDRPWLMVLDGVERLLVSYHRFDAAQLRDEEAGADDAILQQRDPCAAIRDEDDDLLRALAGAAPSKLLLTSRLTPRRLLNAAGQPIPGVRRVPLPGLRPADAEELLRGLDVRGSSRVIRTYLQESCDCHPLVTGVLAGLVLDYFDDRGNFDAWAADPQGGAGLNLAELDLVQKRNDILEAAFAALPVKERELLSTLALLSEAVDGEVLQALNPHLPPEPEKVAAPGETQEGLQWMILPNEGKETARNAYLEKLRQYERAMAARLASPEFRLAPTELRKTVQDLERRSLLQYDPVTRHYDLHPVVRGVAAGGLLQEEREQLGGRAVDHFSSRPHAPYEEAETLDDLRDGLRVVRILVQMGRFEQAAEAYRGGLMLALRYNVEGDAETLTLLRPFFPRGWDVWPDTLDWGAAGYIANQAAIALSFQGYSGEALSLFQLKLTADLRGKRWTEARIGLLNLVRSLLDRQRLAMAERCCRWAPELSELLGSEEQPLVALFHLAYVLSSRGRSPEAQTLWERLDPMGRNWRSVTYSAGEVAYEYCTYLFQQGRLTEGPLNVAEEWTRTGKNRRGLRWVHSLWGEWLVAQGDFAGASSRFAEAVRMAREAHKVDAGSETALALVKLKLGDLPEPREEAKRLAHLREPAHRRLAELWLTIGDRARAEAHALKAYEQAWADGEPYVFRYELDQAKALLDQLGTPIPDLPPYDPDNDPREPWEDEVEAAIERLRAEKAAEQGTKDQERKSDGPPR